MNVLLIGSGAREHAIAWKLRQSPKLGELYAAPGNAGIAQLAEIVPIAGAEVGCARATRSMRTPTRSSSSRASTEIELVIVAPEDPLGFGLADRLHIAGIRAFGPMQAAARIESSKGFAKEIMERYGVPMSVSRAVRRLRCGARVRRVARRATSS